MEENNDKNVGYVCEGTCGAKLTEEEYQNHHTKTCGTEGCTHKGQEFAHKEVVDGHEQGGTCEHGATCGQCS